MLGEHQARSILEGILFRSKATEAEALLMADDQSLTRFAGSEIHQSVSETDVELRIRVVLDKRIGTASTHNLSATAIDETLGAALAAAERVPADQRFAALPDPLPIEPVQAYAAATAECSPTYRAEQVAAICRLAIDAQLDASGAFSTGSSAIAVANSRGVFAYELRSGSDLKIVVTGDDSSGFAERTAMDVTTIDAEAAGREAIDIAIRSRGPVDLEPGQYTVVLEEYAVSELLDYLSYVALGGLAFVEDRSLFAGRLGEQLFGTNVTIVDDPRASDTLARSFDFEGVPTQTVTIVDAGVARAVVHDAYSGTLAGTGSTGHGLPAPNTFGPFAGHLRLSPGTVDRTSLAHGIERGIWVRRFHYVNIADPKRAILTGMTRDGTFLIEHGELSRPVRNLRFTQSVPDALSNVRAIASQTRTIESWLGADVVPAVVIDGFTFTSATVG
ncbi:MAG: TldD/PmbA family protein [Chloroflexota bacterium]